MRMRMRTWMTCALFGLGLGVASSALAQAVPPAIGFMARLTDPEGQPIEGPVDFGAALYDAPSEGQKLWEEPLASVEVRADGLVAHQLGRQPEAPPLDASVFGGAELFLEVTIDSEVMQPRVPLASVPYAMRAEVASRIGELAPEDIAPAAHDHDARYVRPGAPVECASGESVTGITLLDEGASLSCAPPSLADGSVQSSHIAARAITGGHIADGAVGPGQIAGGAVGPAQLQDGSVTSRKLPGSPVAVYKYHPACEAKVGNDPNQATFATNCNTNIDHAAECPKDSGSSNYRCANTLIGYLVPR